ANVVPSGESTTSRPAFCGRENSRRSSPVRASQTRTWRSPKSGPPLHAASVPPSALRATEVKSTSCPPATSSRKDFVGRIVRNGRPVDGSHRQAPPSPAPPQTIEPSPEKATDVAPPL